jgi:Lyzozyme M1 (1,4-beta-N-acetylmuramidase)
MYQSLFIGTPDKLYYPSSWIVDFDWQALADSDIAGVIIRVGTNKTKDPCFDRYLAGLKQIGKKWGIYHAFWPVSGSAGSIAQAQMIPTWCPEIPPLGLWGDLEAGNPGWIQTDAYLQTLDRAYDTPADVYSGGPFLNNHYDSNAQAIMSRRRLWIAGYPNYIRPLGWNQGANHTLHQFTSSYNCPGLPRPCDMSRTNPLVPWPALEASPDLDTELRASIRAKANDILGEL